MPGVSTSTPERANVTFPDLYEATVMELQAGLDAGHFTSVDLVKVMFSVLRRLRWSYLSETCA